jgi:hypothetical protein
MSQQSPTTPAHPDSVPGDNGDGRPDGGGTYGQGDISRAAQKSKDQVEPETAVPHFSEGRPVPAKPGTSGGT